MKGNGNLREHVFADHDEGSAVPERDHKAEVAGDGRVCPAQDDVCPAEPTVRPEGQPHIGQVIQSPLKQDSAIVHGRLYAHDAHAIVNLIVRKIGAVPQPSSDHSDVKVVR